MKKLREEIAGLTDAGLADLLARGEPGGKSPSAQARVPAWLENGQENAYRACLGKGLFLVWGPSGTGKTRVLRSATCWWRASRSCSYPAPILPWTTRCMRR